MTPNRKDSVLIKKSCFFSFFRMRVALFRCAEKRGSPPKSTRCQQAAGFRGPICADRLYKTEQQCKKT